jgi:hypothetical protein
MARTGRWQATWCCPPLLLLALALALALALPVTLWVTVTGVQQQQQAVVKVTPPRWMTWLLRTSTTRQQRARLMARQPRASQPCTW